MELDIRKYLVFLATIFVGFALVHNLSIVLNPKSEPIYWKPQKEAESQPTSVVLPVPSLHFDKETGETKITWTEYDGPVTIQKCVSLEKNLWKTVSVSNYSGVFVDNNLNANSAFYRISYPASL